MSEENVEVVRKLGDEFNAFMRGELSEESKRSGSARSARSSAI